MPTVTVDPEKLDPKVTCRHKYFNFQKGTNWRYKLTTSFPIEGKSSQTNQYFFTNKITSVSTSSAVIETVFDDDDEKILTTLTCRKSGIYGFPLPLTGPNVQSPAVDKSKELFKLGKIDKNILFLPPDSILKVGESWKSILSVTTSIPLLSNVDIMIRNKIVEKNASSLRVQSRIENLNLPLDLIKIPDQKIFDFQIAEGKGVTNLSLNFNLEGKEVVNSKIELLDFKPFLRASFE